MMNVKNFWIKILLCFMVLFPVSVFLHETGHWIVYELNGIESWISLQRANVINPESVTEVIFLRSLFGGPFVTLLLAIGALIFVIKYPFSPWFFVLGLINSTFRLLPILIGMLTASRTDRKGISDEGNIILRIFDNVALREVMLLLSLVLYILIIIRILSVFRFPEDFKRKRLAVWLICLLTVLTSLTYPVLDHLIFGI